MERIYLIAMILLISVTNIHSTTIPLDSIKRVVASFIVEVERIDYEAEYLSNFMFYDRGLKDTIQENKEGVYIFFTLAPATRTHFLLVGKSDFQILNMKEPVDVNILKLIHFFENNEKYDRCRILFYLQDLVRIHQENEEYIKSFGGIIK